MSSIFSEVLQSRHAVRTRLQQEGDSWNHDNLTLAQYNSYFKPYIGNTIDGIVTHMQSRKSKITAVNLMGGTRVLRDLDVARSYAFRLTDDRNLEIKAEDQKKNITLVPGDILSKATLKMVPNEIDILLCMPEGGGEFLPMLPDLFYYFGKSLLDKMSVGGIAMIQLPLSSNSWMVDYSTVVTERNGLSFKYFPKDEKGIQSVLIMEKRNSQARLPIML